MDHRKFDDIIEKFNKAHTIYQNKLQKTFKAAFKEFWKNHKKIKAVTWVQFTPHFNDGEPCEFGVHDLVPMTLSMVDGDSDFDGRYPDRNEGPFQRNWDSPKREFLKQDWEKSDITQEEWNAACTDLNRIQNLPEDVFAAAFGDGYKVTMTRKGAEVEEFDHD